MKYTDQELGMNRPITRRDVLHGGGLIAAGMMFPGSIAAAQQPPGEAPYYPPSLTGIRGNHDGAFDVAHQLGREGRVDWGPVQTDTVIYDLVVVGSGVSGLTSAYYYQKENPDARILILDNHDDFGGHAKRNEFETDSGTLLAHGGSQSFVDPKGFSWIAMTLIRELGVDYEKFETAYDQNFFKKNGLKEAIHFSEENWGKSHTVPHAFGFSGLPVAASDITEQEAVARLPISDAAKEEFIRILTTTTDQLAHIPAADKNDYLMNISYREYLERHLNITEPEVFAVLQDLTSDTGVGIDALSARTAFGYAELLGKASAGLGDGGDAVPYIHHFPDGNASIARLLVRALIPQVVTSDGSADASFVGQLFDTVIKAVTPDTSMEDIVTMSFDYSKLDMDESPVKLRLNSTVTNVVHDGDDPASKTVNVTYIQGGKAFQVQTRNCVLACYNSIIPYLCPSLPEDQKEALSYQVKQPVIYTSVALRNWQAWKKLGIGAAVCPGALHSRLHLNFPVSLGEYAYASSPDEPVIVHMESFPHINNEGLTAQEQFRLYRYELLEMSFESIERDIRTQLTELLGEGGFDPVRDITGITVNRWAHGFAYEHWIHSLFSDVYEDEDDPRYQHVQARKRFGRIAIGNSDAAGTALLDAAIEQGHRAVYDLLEG